MRDCPYCNDWTPDLPEHLGRNHPQHSGQVVKFTTAPHVSPRRALRHLRALYRRTCLACGRREPAIKLTVDHIIPLSWGGTNSLDNFQPLCTECNLAKGARLVDYRGAASAL